MGLTPMMSQYMNIKEKYQDCILFYRLGDFYEMFFEDALTASRELEITLTGRANTPDLYEIMQVLGEKEVVERLS